MKNSKNWREELPIICIHMHTNNRFCSNCKRADTKLRVLAAFNVVSSHYMILNQEKAPTRPVCIWSRKYAMFLGNYKWKAMFPEANFESKNPTGTLVLGEYKEGAFSLNCCLLVFFNPFLCSDWLQWSGYLVCLKSSYKQRCVGERPWGAHP